MVAIAAWNHAGNQRDRDDYPGGIYFPNFGVVQASPIPPVAGRGHAARGHGRASRRKRMSESRREFLRFVVAGTVAGTVAGKVAASCPFDHSLLLAAPDAG